MLKYCLIPLFLMTCVSCYRMPGDDEYSVVPATNNPAVTREKKKEGMEALQSLQGGSF